MIGSLPYRCAAPIVVLTKDQRFSFLFTGGELIPVWMARGGTVNVLRNDPERMSR